MLAWRYRRCAPRSSASPARSTSSRHSPVRILGPITATWRRTRPLRSPSSATRCSSSSGTRSPASTPSRRGQGSGDRHGLLAQRGAAGASTSTRPAYIFAGLRVATATVIGLVHGHALIGLGGLGQQITYGFTIGSTRHHRGLVFRRPGRGLRPAHRRGAAPRRAVDALSRRRGGLMSDWDHFRHFMAAWSAGSPPVQLDWQLGHPYSSYARPSSRSPWCSVAGGGRRHRPRTRPHRPRRPGGGDAANAPGRSRRSPSSPSLPSSRRSRSKWGGFWPPFWRCSSSPSRHPHQHYVGMREVDADVRDAAKAMGLTGGQVLRRVELPLATPFLMAGSGPLRSRSCHFDARRYVSYTDLGTPVISGSPRRTRRGVLRGHPGGGIGRSGALGLGVLGRAITPLPIRHTRSGTALTTA